MATFIERTDDAFMLQVTKFCSKAGTYATALGLDSAKLTAFAKDAALFNFVLPALGAYHDFAESYTNYKNLLRYGRGSEVLGALPVPPTLPLPVPDVTAANMQKRFANLIGDCTSSSNYTKAIGTDLGIEAPDNPFDPEAGKLALKIKLADGGHPVLRTKKGLYEGYELWKDSGSGTFVKLEKVLRSVFTDPSPLPAPGQAAVWKYKGIYLYKDKQAGEWSNEVQIIVYGYV